MFYHKILEMQDAHLNNNCEERMEWIIWAIGQSYFLMKMLHVSILICPTSRV